jgi:hypothetical protein
MTAIRVLRLLLAPHTDCRCPSCQRRQAHPRRHDELRLLAEGVAFLFVIALVVAMASLAPVGPA